MAFHDDLLRRALQLVHSEPKKPKQASLRRGVSTAYYALFHLLISDAVANWRRPEFRATLGRAFDHKTMKDAFNRLKNSPRAPFKGADQKVVEALKAVAETFAQLQEKRHTADYDNTTFWTRNQALTEVNLAEEAFSRWKAIRNERIAQEYLVSLMVKRRD